MSVGPRDWQERDADQIEAQGARELDDRRVRQAGGYPFALPGEDWVSVAYTPAQLERRAQREAQRERERQETDQRLRAAMAEHQRRVRAWRERQAFCD